MVTKPIALWGFMGSGKTSVGKALAQKLGCEFVDTDEVIAKKFNKPITRIFAEDGEAVFRQAESELLTELLQRQHIVIATGGGMPMVPENLSALRAKALNFYLRVPIDVIYERLAMVNDRPLLEGFSDRYWRIATLLAQRERFYTQAQIIVNCGRGSPEQISERIYAWVRALENEDDAVTADLQERSYQVVVGKDLASRIDHIAEACDLQSPFAVVHDESVSDFAEKVCEQLGKKGKTERRAVPSGEASKSIEQTIALWHWLAEMAMGRFLPLVVGLWETWLVSLQRLTCVELRMFKSPRLCLRWLTVLLVGKQRLIYLTLKTLSVLSTNPLLWQATFRALGRYPTALSSPGLQKLSSMALSPTHSCLNTFTTTPT